MQALAETALFSKIRALPPKRVSEVEDFVDFLRSRESETRLATISSLTSQTSFSAVWDNDEDAAYDRL
jgi:hypothetical protein